MVLHSQSANPKEQLEVKEEIEKLETALKEKRIQHTGSNEEKARTNVQRQIKRALAKIHEMCPALERYLNISTIKTGYSCSYQPVPNDPVEWISFEVAIPLDRSALNISDIFLFGTMCHQCDLKFHTYYIEGHF